MASVLQTNVSGKADRALIYCRVSDPKQKEGYSLETQDELARAYCGQCGYVLVESVPEIETGAYLWERKQLSQIREIIRQHLFEVLVCHAVDRISRNQAHLYILAEELERAGVRLEFVTEVFEDTAVGKFLRSAKAFAAEVEREKFRERSLRGRRARVASGKLIHGKTPMYGYSWDDDGKAKYVENPMTAPVVRRMFADLLAGGTLRGIATKLTDAGVPTPRNARVWDFTTVGHILRESRYAGEAFAFRIRHWKVGGKQFHELRPRDEWLPLPEGTIPPLIDWATFEAVQERLAQNKRESSRALSCPEAFLLRSGYVRCGHCGDSLSAVTKTVRGKSLPTYTCPRGDRGPVPCTHHGISATRLDQAVWTQIESILTQPEIIAGELERVRSEDSTVQDLDTVDRGLADVARKQGNLGRRVAVLDDDDAAAPLLAELTTLARQRKQLESERASILSRRDGWQAAQAQLKDVEAWCRDVAQRLGKLTYEQKRLALDMLGVQVNVWRSDHTPRYHVTASIPLDDELGQGRQVSRLYEESQNPHSYRLLMT
jgi:site-specific DNA recombinase